MGWVWVALACVWVGATVSRASMPETFTNDFVVELTRDDDAEADLIAERHGVTKINRVLKTGNLYHFRTLGLRRAARSAEDVYSRLMSDPHVSAVYQQRLLKLEKRRGLSAADVKELMAELSGGRALSAKTQQKKDLEFFNDMKFRDMWQLVNRGQTDGTPYVDMNVLPAWKMGLCGLDVSVLVVDDGLDHTHPDLEPQYDPSISDDFQSETDNDPYPNFNTTVDNSHGTKCAGEIAAVADNKICGTGVAYCVTIGGIRLLDGPVTDLMEGQALTFMNQKVDIVSASWGPPDDGKTMEGPHEVTSAALEEGTRLGRNGLGTLFIFAAGNGGGSFDTTNADGLVSSRFTIGIGSINADGHHAYYSEMGSSISFVVPVGGRATRKKRALDLELTDFEAEREGIDNLKKGMPLYVTTTDVHGKCTQSFIGTSAAAPLATGCFALMLQANPDLTWRDAQHVGAETARIPAVENDGWMWNGGGYHVNHKYGFGLLDCSRMAELADGWTSVPDEHRCLLGKEEGLDRKIAPNADASFEFTSDGCRASAEERVSFVEHVEVSLNMTMKWRGDVRVLLESPAGTRALILENRPFDNETEINFMFTSNFYWGEDPTGTWKLEVHNKPQDKDGSREAGDIVMQDILINVYGMWNYTRPEGGERPSQDENKAAAPAAPAPAQGASALTNLLSNNQQEIKYLTTIFGRDAVAEALRRLQHDGSQMTGGEASAARGEPTARDMTDDEVKRVMSSELQRSQKVNLRSRGPVNPAARSHTGGGNRKRVMEGGERLTPEMKKMFRERGILTNSKKKPDALLQEAQTAREWEEKLRAENLKLEGMLRDAEDQKKTEEEKKEEKPSFWSKANSVVKWLG